MNNKQVTLILLLIAVFGLSGILFATRKGPGISPDSVVYIGAAQNIIDGHGITVPFGDQPNAPMTHRPPFLSMVLAIPGWMGIDPVTGVKLVNAILFGLMIFILGISLLKILRTKPITAIIGSLLLLTAPTMMLIHVHAWTEPLFIALAIGGLIVLSFFLQNHRYIHLVIAAVLIGLAAVTRYAGVAVIAAGALSVLLFRNGKLFDRLRDSVVFGVIGSLPLLFYMLMNFQITGAATSRSFNFHLITRSHIVQATDTLANWFLIPTSLNGLIKIGLIGVLSLGALALLYLQYRNSEEDPKTPYLIQVLIVLIAIYSAFLVFSISVFDAATPLDYRILSPVFFSLVVIFAYYLDWFINHYPGIPAVRYASIFIAAVFVVGYSYASVKWIVPNSEAGIGFSNQVWRSSQMVKEIDKIPADKLIYSNAPHAVYILSGKSARSLPKSFTSVDQQINEDYRQELEQVNLQVQNGESVVVYFYHIELESEYIEDDLINLSPISVFFQSTDGSIYGSIEGN